MDWRIHLFCIILLVLSITPNIVFALENELQSFTKVYQNVIDTLERYVKKETERFNSIKSFSESLIKEHEILKKSNFDNSKDIFKLIKWLTSDLDYLDNETKKRTAFHYVGDTNSTLIYPTHEHLKKALFVVTMIQYTYGLNVSQLADGVLNISFNPNNTEYVTYSSPLNDQDCLEIGRVLYEDEKYDWAIEWLLEAFRRNYKRNKTKADVMEYIVNTYINLRKISEAKFWIQKFLQIIPEHPRRQEFSNFVEEYENTQHNSDNLADALSIDDIIQKCLWMTEYLHQKTCRGETRIVNKVAKRLKCKYLTENHPFLKLAPVKIEELFLEPDVYLFHNLISDREIKYIEDITKTRFEPCALLKPTGNTEVYQSRLCESTFLDTKFISEELFKIYRRIVDVTGMTVNFSEELHVVKYWVGGYYAAHTDFWRNTTYDLGHEVRGNRIATLLFYLASPLQGGATAFPHLGLNVYPVKGSALFWRNLYPSGEGDMDTVHASCPIIQGTKMIMTQWFSSIGQELSMPCTLNRERGWRNNLELPILSKVTQNPSQEEININVKKCRRYDSTKVFKKY